MKVNPSIIPAPSKKERFALRAMIFVGLFSVFFFLYTITKEVNIGYTPLYVLLMLAMLYSCVKFIHEWYHYFSLSVPKKPTHHKQYTVDVLTTYCAGEPFDMLEQTLRAIQNITYPHTAWCCDEADDPAVKALCEELGVRHVTRIIKKDAKAGNINNALKYATGELCVVMDPDHVPCPQMLDYIVPYFEDEKIGFVQIVQAYYNQHESLVAKGAAQQTYQFYGPMMMCMNTYGTVQAIGANCTFRRTALDSIGGHAAGLSEDMHTAMQLHAKGWKSIYVPAILTRGLVPATLSSYFKQQLKWSRGTWELLLVTYPKLFTKFNWRQKLHYFLLPFHYLSGIIFFINFLIPVISLFTGYIPLKMDVVSFMLAALPLSGISIFIRHYVQKWVAEETERGFHIVGGILQISAWWVHSIGFVYTLLRKKVPYIPTPKNDTDPLPFILNVPNIFIAAVSLVAIFYGFNYNYNPYTLFMAILASMQVCFMIFIFSVSGYTTTGGTVETIAKKVRNSNTWLIIKTHSFIRKYSVALAVILVTGFVFAYKQTRKLPTFLPKPIAGLQVFYKGIYEPSFDNGLTSVSKVLSGKQGTDLDLSIFSFYLSANSKGAVELPFDIPQVVYRNKAIPLINWYPFQETTDSFSNDLFRNITAHKYDSVIKAFAMQMSKLNMPFFLRPQFTTPEKSSAAPYKNISAQNFIAAWQHIHLMFDSAGADKAIWVWSAPGADYTGDFYPGKKYADWLGVSILDTATVDAANNSFYKSYAPYHNSALFQSGMPVMITEAGTRAVQKMKWWKKMETDIEEQFTEIKSVIILNDQVHSDGYYAGNTQKIFNTLKNTSAAKSLSKINATAGTVSKLKKYVLPDSIKGVLFDKGYHWFRNRHTMTKKTLEHDITEMKKIGINTVERTMPGFYDDVIDRLLTANNIRQVGRLSFNPDPELMEDKTRARQETDRLLRIVRDNMDKKNIIAWNLGDDILFDLENETFKPDFFYYRNLYLAWLADLCKQLRSIDKERPITIDLQWDDKGEERYGLYKRYVPDLNMYLLSATSKYKDGLTIPLKEDMTWGKVPVELWKSLPSIKRAGFIPAWQDIENTDFITLNGILDLDGKKKNLYATVANTWGGMHLDTEEIPLIKILKPLQATRVNANLTYSVLIKKDSTQWRLYSSNYEELHFEWYLVRIDQYGNTMFIKKVAYGPYISLPIPDEPQYYELYVEAIKDDKVVIAKSTLNTPLY